MNKWKIPDWLEREVKDRDRHCVYCRAELGSSKETGRSMADMGTHPKRRQNSESRKHRQMLLRLQFEQKHQEAFGLARIRLLQEPRNH